MRLLHTFQQKLPQIVLILPLGFLPYLPLQAEEGRTISSETYEDDRAQLSVSTSKFQRPEEHTKPENPGKKLGKENTLTVIATGNERDSFEVPMMVSVVEADDPSLAAVPTAAGLLKYVPGVTLMGAGRANGQDIHLRGYNHRGVLVLVDGVRQGTDTGHINGTFLDGALIKRVEVVRGPGALLYGSGALGGVIAYKTVDAADLLKPGKDTGYRLTGRVGTQDSSGGISAMAYGRNDFLDGVIGLSVRDRGDLRMSDGFHAKNDETISNMISRGTWHIDDNQTLSGSLRYYHNDAYEPKNPQEPEGYAAEKAPNNPLAHRLTIQRDAQAMYHITSPTYSWIDANLSGYYSDVLITSRPDRGPYEGRKQDTLGAKFENRTRLFIDSPAVHQLTYGTEAYKQKQRPNAAALGFPPASINFASGWLQDEITVRDLPVSLIAGTRYDNYRADSDKYAEISADNWSSRAAVTVTPIQWLMLFGSYAEAFRAPSIGEMYNDSLHFQQGPIVNYWKPNPHLKPETTSTQEVGFGLRFEGILLDSDALQLKSSYFDTRAKDYIDTEVTMKVGPGGCIDCSTTSVNRPSAKLSGWDALLQYQTAFLDWQLAYSHIKGKDGNGAWLGNIYPDTVNSKLNFPLDMTGFSVGWVATIAAHNDRVNSGTEPQGGYGINDFYINYNGQNHWQDLTATLTLGNAFDKEYRSSQGIIQDGRNLGFLVSYQW